MCCLDPTVPAVGWVGRFAAPAVGWVGRLAAPAVGWVGSEDRLERAAVADSVDERTAALFRGGGSLVAAMLGRAGD